jgi:hypothetical protein
VTRLPREVRKELARLRTEWRVWATGGPHLDFGLVCPDRCGECEACAVTAYRAERTAEIAARAAALKEVTP